MSTLNPTRRPETRRISAILVIVLAGFVAGVAGVDRAGAEQGPTEPGYVEGEVLVTGPGGAERVRELPEGVEVSTAVRRLRRSGRVASAVPNYIARAAYVPNDPGRDGRVAGAWRRDQWNFRGHPAGVRAPRAWTKLRRTGHPGGAQRPRKPGVTIAVVDTGVAYRKLGRRYRRSPDLRPKTFVAGHDFVDDDRVPLDKTGHGTHVASTIAESVDNRRAVTGLAYRARIMPVRVLDGGGFGTARDVAAGIRWATRNGARIINLSLEFGSEVERCEDIPGVCRAIRLARQKGVLVVAAAGNDSPDGRVSYPGRVALAVGGTTERGCVAEYSNHGAGLDLVAPGGGRDAAPLDVAPADPGPNCDRDAGGRGIVQLTLRPGFGAQAFRRFGYPYYEGTSMAAAHVSAIAGLAVGSRILHRRLDRPPRPAELEAHLKETACAADCGMSSTELYGAGLIDAAAAVGAGGG